MSGNQTSSNPEELTQDDVLTQLRESTVVMLTTATADQKLVSHPMTIQGTTEDADVWFFVSRSGGQAEALAQGAAVNISIAQPGSWLSVAGQAAVVDDPAKVEELWDDSAEGYFPGGVGDPDLALLLVTTTSAQHWGLRGGRIAGLAQMVKARVTGERAGGGTDTTEL